MRNSLDAARPRSVNRSCGGRVLRWKRLPRPPPGPASWRSKPSSYARPSRSFAVPSARSHPPPCWPGPG